MAFTSAEWVTSAWLCSSLSSLVSMVHDAASSKLLAPSTAVRVRTARVGFRWRKNRDIGLPYDVTTFPGSRADEMALNKRCSPNTGSNITAKRHDRGLLRWIDYSGLNPSFTNVFTTFGQVVTQLLSTAMVSRLNASSSSSFQDANPRTVVPDLPLFGGFRNCGVAEGGG